MNILLRIFHSSRRVSQPFMHSLTLPFTLSFHTLQPGTQVTNLINGVHYLPTDGLTGTDTFSYQFIHNGMVSSVATIKISVQSWDFPPVIPSSATANPVVIVNRQATSLNLPVKDNQQKQYLGVYIMSLPTKGTLYQRNPDGSLGTVIDRPFQYSFPAQSVQYANKVLNVSSFWTSSADWSPIQALGPQDCFGYAGCRRAWTANTFSGTGGFAKVECSDAFSLQTCNIHLFPCLMHSFDVEIKLRAAVKEFVSHRILMRTTQILVIPSI